MTNNTNTMVLVPLDGSALSESSLPYATTIARAIGASLLLFSVSEPHGLDRPASGSSVTDAGQQRLRELSAYLDHVAQRPEVAALGTTVRAVEGTPVDAILAACNDPAVAMTVIATHGRGGMRRAVLGSVADKVMRLAATPVLSVRPAEDQDGHDSTAAAIRRIMVPLDGSALAEAALPWATTLAQGLRAAVVLVRATPLIMPIVGSPAAYPATTIDAYTDIEQREEELARAYLSEVRERIATGIDVEVTAARMQPLQLPDYATSAGFDLVVMTTRGHGGLKRLLLGSVADRMARLGPPVLLVPPRDVEQETGTSAGASQRG